jgi:hypothetical protein
MIVNVWRLRVILQYHASTCDMLITGLDMAVFQHIVYISLYLGEVVDENQRQFHLMSAAPILLIC